jgi:hypothetical protein
MSTTTPGLCPTRWPGITFTDAGKARLQEVSDFLDTLPEKHPEVAKEIRAAFIGKLDYLNTYSGDPGDPNKRFRVELHSDWSDYSFSVCWLRASDGAFAFNGGLVWHGGSNETFTVSLTPQWWGVHT